MRKIFTRSKGQNESSALLIEYFVNFLEISPAFTINRLYIYIFILEFKKLINL